MKLTKHEKKEIPCFQIFTHNKEKASPARNKMYLTADSMTAKINLVFWSSKTKIRNGHKWYKY